MNRAAANTKSGAVGVAWAAVLKFYEFLSTDLAWDITAIIEPSNLETFVGGLKLWVVAGGFGAAYWRDRDSIRHPSNVEGGRSDSIVPQRSDLAPPATSITDWPTYAWSWSATSLRRMEGVNPAIIELLTVALRYCRYDAGIAHQGGLRVLAEQQDLVARGASETLNSRHLHGMALDVVMYDERGNLTWDKRYFLEFKRCVEHAEIQTGIPFTWGGTWASGDYGHFHLPRNRGYPDKSDIELS